MKRLIVVWLSIVALASCGELGGDATGNAIGNLACPELRGGAENANFEADARANATIRAFVMAAGDLAPLPPPPRTKSDRRASAWDAISACRPNR